VYVQRSPHIAIPQYRRKLTLLTQIHHSNSIKKDFCSDSTDSLFFLQSSATAGPAKHVVKPTMTAIDWTPITVDDCKKYFLSQYSGHFGMDVQCVLNGRIYFHRQSCLYHREGYEAWRFHVNLEIHLNDYIASSTTDAALKNDATSSSASTLETRKASSLLGVCKKTGRLNMTQINVEAFAHLLQITEPVMETPSYKSILHDLFLCSEAVTFVVTLDTTKETDMSDISDGNAHESSGSYFGNEITVRPIVCQYTCPNSSKQYQYTIEYLIADATTRTALKMQCIRDGGKTHIHTQDLTTFEIKSCHEVNPSQTRAELVHTWQSFGSSFSRTGRDALPGPEGIFFATQYHPDDMKEGLHMCLFCFKHFVCGSRYTHHARGTCHDNDFEHSYLKRMKPAINPDFDCTGYYCNLMHLEQSRHSCHFCGALFRCVGYESSASRTYHECGCDVRRRNRWYCTKCSGDDDPRYLTRTEEIAKQRTFSQQLMLA
jgi:hypothetical protein